MVPMIDRYLLRYFLAVIDQGNFSRAATQCGVSQPSLSVGIARLERDLGCSLFERSSRRVELTAHGVRLAAHARRIEADFLLAEALGDAESAPLRLRLGVIATLPTRWIEAAINRIRAQLPALKLELVEGREAELQTRLDRGRIDAALTLVRDPGSRAIAIFDEGYALAMAESHPLAARESVAAEEVADNVMLVRRQCEVLAQTSRHFTTRGVRPFMAARSLSDDRILAYVRAGLGITLMPCSYAHEGIAMPRLAGFDLRRTIGLVTAPKRDSPAARTMLETIATTLAPR